MIEFNIALCQNDECTVCIVTFGQALFHSQSILHAHITEYKNI